MILRKIENVMEQSKNYVKNKYWIKKKYHDIYICMIYVIYTIVILIN